LTLVGVVRAAEALESGSQSVSGWFTEGFDTADLKDARMLLGAKGGFGARFITILAVSKFFRQAPARRSCDVLDFGPLWGRKTNTGVFLSVLRV
jgi:hypothetical protein